MLDPNFIRISPELVKKNIVERGMDPKLVDEWLLVDSERRALIHQIDGIRSLRKTSDPLISEEAKSVARAEREKLAEVEKKLPEIQRHWLDLLNQIPNLHLPDVPIGKNDSGNVVLSKTSKNDAWLFTPKDHVQIALDHDLIDFERGAKVASSQFYFLKNQGVLLEFALITFGLRFLMSKGFTPIQTPDLAKSRYYNGTGYIPRGDEAQTYEIKDEDLGLIATAEIAMAGYHADEVFNEKDLPKKYIAFSHCFRKEAGSYGKYSKGLYRTHQFSKLEMFVYCTPEQSSAIHEELLHIEKEILDLLGLPYRVLSICTGDLGAMAAKKYDVEAWMPGRNDYGEVTSTSNCLDYQARNLNIKYKNTEGKLNFVHMLNGTAMALSRLPIAILENNQQADGAIVIPDILKKYCPGMFEE